MRKRDSTKRLEVGDKKIPPGLCKLLTLGLDLGFSPTWHRHLTSLSLLEFKMKKSKRLALCSKMLRTSPIIANNGGGP